MVAQRVSQGTRDKVQGHMTVWNQLRCLEWQILRIAMNKKEERDFTGKFLWSGVWWMRRGKAERFEERKRWLTLSKLDDDDRLWVDFGFLVAGLGEFPELNRSKRLSRHAGGKNWENPSSRHSLPTSSSTTKFTTFSAPTLEQQEKMNSKSQKKDIGWVDWQ
jgi:hypothetical protein